MIKSPYYPVAVSMNSCNVKGTAIFEYLKSFKNGDIAAYDGACL